MNLAAFRLVCGVSLLAGSVLAAETLESRFLVESWQSDKGLPNDTVTAVAQTPDGFLWVGTQNGLTRFDGWRFLGAADTVALAFRGKNISSLATDRQGALWVATRGAGLFRLRGGVVEEVAVGATNVLMMINSLSFDSDGALLLATAERGVLRRKAGGWEDCGDVKRLPSPVVGQVICDVTGQVWCLADRQLFRLVSGQWQEVESLKQSGIRPQVISPARRGGVWAATSPSGRVLHVTPEGGLNEQPRYPTPHPNERSRVTSLHEDQRGNLWLGTFGGGVFYLPSEGQWTLLREEGPLAELIVDVIAGDDEGSVWVGLRSGGLHRVRPRKVASLRLPSSASQSIVLVTCATRDGSVWVGTDGAGAFRYQAGGFTHYGAAEGFERQDVRVLLEDSQTNLWVGTGGGLYRFNGREFERAVGPDAIRAGTLSLMEDRQGRIWVSTEGGVVCFQRGAARIFAYEAWFLALVEDSKGQIWGAGQGVGLYRLEGDRFVRHAAGQWPEEQSIRSLHADAEGSLWIAGHGRGLFQLKDGQFRRWNEADGLPSDYIHAVVEDESQNLWLATDNGVFACAKAALENHVSGRSAPLLCRRVSVEDGMASKVCTGFSQPVVGRTDDGRFWFPNRQSLAVFNPKDFAGDGLIRPAVVEQVLADGEPVKASLTDDLRVSSRARRFEFRFTSPNLQNAARLHFRHRLVGLEENWVDANDQRAAYYGHLSPGRYEFQVAVGEPGGEWHETGGARSLEILPQWWERRWLQAGALLLLIGAVAGTSWGVARARGKRKLRQVELRAGLERERRRIAQDLHDDLGAGLTDLMMLAEAVGRDKLAPAEVPGRATQIVERVRTLAAATDEIVWTMNPRHDSVRNLIGYLSDFAQSFVRSSTARCRLDVPEGLPDHELNAAARHNLLLAFKEALNNAIKHSGATEIWFRVRCDLDGITILVEDNGPGFDVLKPPGSGDGLANIRDRMQSVGGRGEITSQRGQGTVVALFLPLAIST